MVRGKPLDLGHRSFNSQKDAQDYFREMIYQYQVGDVITEGENFFHDIRSLIDRHPERGQKVGVGIAAFIIRLDENRNQMLWLRRADGSETDFSYLTCVRGSGMSLNSEFAQAARLAVRPDISEFKESYFQKYADSSGKAPCQESGILMSIGDAHVDHHPLTFQDLLKDFLSYTNIVPSRVFLSAPADNQTATTFVCNTTEGRFIEYHRDHATLMVVCQSVNLTRKRK